MARTKTERMEIRLSEDQKTMLDAQAESMGMTRSRYVLYLVEREEKTARLTAANADDQQAALAAATENRKERISLFWDEDLTRVIWHLGHWGNNLNQAVRAINGVATKTYLSLPKKKEIIDKALGNINDAICALSRIERAVYALRDEKHIVMEKK